MRKGPKWKEFWKQKEVGVGHCWKWTWELSEWRGRLAGKARVQADSQGPEPALHTACCVWRNPGSQASGGGIASAAHRPGIQLSGARLLPLQAGCTRSPPCLPSFLVGLPVSASLPRWDRRGRTSCILLARPSPQLTLCCCAPCQEGSRGKAGSACRTRVLLAALWPRRSQLPGGSGGGGKTPTRTRKVPVCKGFQLLLAQLTFHFYPLIVVFESQIPVFPSPFLLKLLYYNNGDKLV